MPLLEIGSQISTFIERSGQCRGAWHGGQTLIFPATSVGHRTRFRLVSQRIFLSNRGVSHWTVILLGVIEGVTEFLPVSSTGHLLLAERWLNLPSQPTELFNVLIQSGA